MFPSIILEVYFMKNKKSGKRSENILVKNITSLGNRSRDSCVAAHRDNRWTSEAVLPERMASHMYNKAINTVYRR